MSMRKFKDTRKYRCDYCDRKYNTKEEAENCICIDSDFEEVENE